jgi:hypothetical protein
MIARTRRGQPLIGLALLLVSWVGVRVAMWEAPGAPLSAPALAAASAPLAVTPDPLRAQVKPNAVQPAPLAVWAQAYRIGDAPPGSADQAQTPVRPNPAPLLAETPPPPVAAPSNARIAAGHQLLYLAALSQVPLPPEVAAQFATRPSLAVSPARPATARPQSRWSADAWLLWRRGGNGFNLPGAGLPGANLPSGAYGASQAGAVIRYRLGPASAHRPALYLRASSALEKPRGEEAALGLSLRPLPRVPVAAMGEVRVTRTLSGDIVRPTTALVSEFPPLVLPLGAKGEAYVQAGWVGGKHGTLFADGQARIEKPLLRAAGLELRAGAGAWGGAQEGASRLDFGPSATLAVPLGPAGGRLSADWRFRVAGHAAPGSGPAITLSAGF